MLDSGVVQDSPQSCDYWWEVRLIGDETVERNDNPGGFAEHFGKAATLLRSNFVQEDILIQLATDTDETANGIERRQTEHLLAVPNRKRAASLLRRRPGRTRHESPTDGVAIPRITEEFAKQVCMAFYPWYCHAIRGHNS